MTISISEALSAATLRLSAGAVETPGLDARLLLQWVTGLDTAHLIARSSALLTDEQERQFERAVAGRAGGCPVARIIGEKQFWGLDLELSFGTLVPRPDTETLVETVLGRIDGPRADWTGAICDLGTGSGAILIALLQELPRATGVGVDISADAIATARRNAERHQIADRSAWHVADYADWPQARADQSRFDIVVSNPPYVAEADLAALAAEVREHDPNQALIAGADGLDAYRILAGQIPHLLRRGGLAALELGFGQADAVTALTHSQGLEQLAVKADLAGISRVLLVQWP